MSDYHEMFTQYTKGIDPDIIKRMQADQQPVKQVKCLNCGAMIIKGKKCCNNPNHNNV
jgi:hypothetical protein